MAPSSYAVESLSRGEARAVLEDQGLKDRSGLYKPQVIFIREGSVNVFDPVEAAASASQEHYRCSKCHKWMNLSTKVKHTTLNGKDLCVFIQTRRSQQAEPTVDLPPDLKPAAKKTKKSKAAPASSTGRGKTKSKVKASKTASIDSPAPQKRASKTRTKQQEEKVDGHKRASKRIAELSQVEKKLSQAEEDSYVDESEEEEKVARTRKAKRKDTGKRK